MADGNGNVSSGSSNGAVAASLINGATQLGAAAMQNMGNKRQNREHREWLEKMYDLQYQRNVELWNLQNAYNAPSSQVKRLREAGLNPNLMYGNGSGSTGLAGDIGTPTLPSGSEPMKYDFSQASNGIASALAMYQNWQMNNLNMQKTREEASNIASNTAYVNAMRSGQLTKNKLLGVDLTWADKNYAVDYISKHFGIGRTASEIFLNNARKREVELGITQNSAAFETKMELLKSQVFQAKANALNSFGNYLESRDKIISGYYGSLSSQARSVAGLNNEQRSFNEYYHGMGLATPSGNLLGLPVAGLGILGNQINKNIVEPIQRFFKR